MGDGDRLDAAMATYVSNRFVIKERYTIPEQVPFLSFHQVTLLTNRKLRPRDDAHQILFFKPNLILETLPAQLVHRCPLLSVNTNVLTFVIADRATIRNACGIRELSSALRANEFQPNSTRCSGFMKYVSFVVMPGMTALSHLSST